MSEVKEKPDLPYEPSTIENIDMALYNWLNDKLDLYSDTNQGWKKVPVIWVAGERSWQVKNNRDRRDSNNVFILPSITLERTSMTKDPTKKGKYWGNVFPEKDEKGGSIAIHQVINQEKTSDFAKAGNKRITGQPNFKRENKKVVYKTKIIPMPVYVTMDYTIDIKTEYQQQMNTLLQPFVTHTGGISAFIIENNGHKYEAFIQQNYQTKNNVNDLQQNERSFSTQITIKVLGYLIGENGNSIRPKIIERENIVDVKIPKEYLIVGQDKIVAPFPLENTTTQDDGVIIQTSNGDYIIFDFGDE